MSQPLILVFANSAYEAVLQNWLAAIERLAVKNYQIIALDRTLKKSLLAQGVRVKYHRCGSKHSDLWKLRVRILLKYLKQGQDVIHCDADAVWLEDPQPLVSREAGDLLFSQGIDWPRDVHKEWGFVLCCGFFMARANPRTRHFMRSWLKRVKQDGDDQISCNRLLMESGLKWEPSDSLYTTPYNGITLRCSREPLHGSSEQLSVTLLPQHWVLRAEDTIAKAAVMHPHSEKNSAHIRETLKQKGCWFI